MDLVGIEPTTSSMPWKKHTSRRLILKRLATGRLDKNRYIGRYFRPNSGQKFQQCETAELHGRGVMQVPNTKIQKFKCVIWCRLGSRKIMNTTFALMIEMPLPVCNAIRLNLN